VSAAQAFITRFDASNSRHDLPVKSRILMRKYFDRKEARKYDIYCQFGLIAADEAVKDAAFNMEKLDQYTLGVIMASGVGGLDTLISEVKIFWKGDGTPRFNPFFIPK